MPDSTVTIEELKSAGIQYKENEGRASFYDEAALIAKEYPLQASVIVLAVWNTMRFRFMTSHGENLFKLKSTLDACRPLFTKTEGYKIQTADIQKIRPVIQEIYGMLSKIKGVEYTGASKVMSLMNPELFVMWDDRIRKHYKIDTHDGSSYVEFLSKIKKEVKAIDWSDTAKPLAKAVDEYNYVQYTLPELRKRKKSV